MTDIRVLVAALKHPQGPNEPNHLELSEVGVSFDSSLFKKMVKKPRLTMIFLMETK